jgi:predicted acetyltransferase
MNPRLTLHRPDPALESSFLAGLDEMTNDSDRRSWIYMGDQAPVDLPRRDFAKFVADLRARETEVPAPGWVRDTTYWAVLENGGASEVVGRIAFRHELTDFLLLAGGHIGYIVRPSYRRQGLATRMLGLLLETERARALGRVLLTCNADNAASEKTIMANGGVLENVVEVGPTQVLKKRFWIRA